MKKLLVIDDNEEIRKQLTWGLKKEYELLLSGNASEALALFRRCRPKVVTLDLGLPPNEHMPDEGFRCLEQILMDGHAKVIVVTGNEERENALKAVQMGAYDYYQKPIDLKDLRVIINRAFQLYDIEEENLRLHCELEKKSTGLGEMVAQCHEMLEVFSTIRKVASSDVNVLVVGESGTGKELVAKAIHANSLRNNGPFVPIDCGAIPENLLESELFGHEKGAFTGAYTRLQGKVEYADKGTLFLDEIGELPANLQAKLLRFLQENVIQRVGGREYIPVDARIIAATNVEIAKAIEGGMFREDLYYRIGVITIKLPPLRERRDDIMLLSNLFLGRFGHEFKKKVKGFSASSIKLLESYDWPGNVRELENRIQRAVIMVESSIIEPGDLGFEESQENRRIYRPEITNLKEARSKVEKEMIVYTMEKHDGNVARTADELGISRPTLYDLLKKHSLCNIHDTRQI
jgi:two-component system NtrC family response regulator